MVDRKRTDDQPFVTFYKARNQATIIWDPKRDKPAVTFDKGMTFTTNDPIKIAMLTEMGYSQEPPRPGFGENSGFVKTSEIATPKQAEDLDI